MNAAEYYVWWKFSGAAVGATTPGETYRQIARKLSPAGVQAAVATEFLQQNPAAIDLARWRAGLFEYEPLKFTIEALDAIGADKTTTALRVGYRARCRGTAQRWRPGRSAELRRDLVVESYLRNE